MCSTRLNSNLSVFSFRDNSGQAQYSMDDGSTWADFKHPVGTKSITANGTYDVTDYASASVNVQHNEYSEILSTISVDPSGANQAGVIRQIYNNHTVSGVGIYRASGSTGGINPGFCFSIRYSGGTWTVTLNRNCYVNNGWYGAGATISWAYNAWQNLVFIPA